jgi:hypothetical protein
MHFRQRHLALRQRAHQAALTSHDALSS